LIKLRWASELDEEAETDGPNVHMLQQVVVVTHLSLVQALIKVVVVYLLDNMVSFLPSTLLLVLLDVD